MNTVRTRRLGKPTYQGLRQKRLGDPDASGGKGGGWGAALFDALPDIIEAGGGAAGDVIDAARDEPDVITTAPPAAQPVNPNPPPAQDPKPDEGSFLSSAAMPLLAVGAIVVVGLVIGLVVVMRS